MSKDVDEFLKILMSRGVSESIKRMVMSLTYEGKKALVDFYDEKSEFHKYADIERNVYNFGVNTDSNMMIYHYTTVKSLQKILASGYFRLKATDYMNDPDEFKWASKLGKIHLEKLGATEDELIAFSKMNIAQPFNDSYIWSFTKNGDSQNLFNVYGDSSGVSLGFSLKDVMTVLASHNSNGKQRLTEFKDGDAYTFPLQVEYDEKIQKNYVFPVVEEWLYAYRSYKKDPYDMNEILLRCSKNIFLFNMVFKNPVLCQEEELRFVVLRIGKDRRNPEFELNGVPYTKCPIAKNFIQSIRLQTGSSYSIDQIKDILNEYEQNSLIYRSKIPY